MDKNTEFLGIKLFNNKKVVTLILLLVVILIYIYNDLFLYKYNLRGSKYDLLNKQIFNTEIPGLHTMETIGSGWQVSHTVLFTILGFFAPNHLCELFVSGVIFEWWEALMEFYYPEWTDTLYYDRDPDGDQFKIARSTDLLFNGVGLGIGYGLHKLFVKKI